ncbi:branched-chain amino acid ABC transporter permease [Kyrpidia sp.]|uniref:branched-chain amino acid ABC transporter permease n=1 Tax=Kyrpidia sp. TaxID=2073077 RepID=UPI001818602F|nr:branched-chain amino acid ABC transporter permease [Kyrpidia sp.]MCL6575053.1 branched-chain amino acid ABC transporter permease [Kyrpidia sp.]HHY67255.1 branched-chain amino acid ABC transporter permease [Alicyclobacillus sp.]
MNEFLQQTVNGLVMGSCYTLIALGLTLIFGMLDMVNFAHGDLYMVGAFIAVACVGTLGVPYYLSILVAMIAVALLGVLLERIAFRPLEKSSRVNLLVSSIGISIILQNGVQLLWGPDPRPLPSPLANSVFGAFGITLNAQRILVVGVALGLIVLVYLLIQKTNLGIAMRAVALDSEVAALMGVRLNRILAATFALGAGLAAVAGVLLGPMFNVYPTMGVSATLKAFVVVLLGGIGNVAGAIAGGFLLGLMETYTAGYISSEYKDVISFILMILVLLFKPNGIFGTYVQEKV